MTSLKVFHCVYFPDPSTMLVNCINIEAPNMLEAIKSFKAKFPKHEPLYVLHQVDMELLKKEKLSNERI